MFALKLTQIGNSVGVLLGRRRSLGHRRETRQQAEAERPAGSRQTFRRAAKTR